MNSVIQMWKIKAQGLTQHFNQRKVFENVSFEIGSGESMAIVGPNGSGKTTLIRIISQLLRPRAGEVIFMENKSTKKSHELYSALGLVGPYLQLYNHLTAQENYSFFCKIRGIQFDIRSFKKLMEKLGLAGRETDELRDYSSGMLQRMKYVCALLHQPEILLLDEPTSNMDKEGSQIVYGIMEEQKKDKILILATNKNEEAEFGDGQVNLAA